MTFIELNQISVIKRQLPAGVSSAETIKQQTIFILIFVSWLYSEVGQRCHLFILMINFEPLQHRSLPLSVFRMSNKNPTKLRLVKVEFPSKIVVKKIIATKKNLKTHATLKSLYSAIQIVMRHILSNNWLLMNAIILIN